MEVQGQLEFKRKTLRAGKLYASAAVEKGGGEKGKPCCLSYCHRGWPHDREGNFRDRSWNSKVQEMLRF